MPCFCCEGVGCRHYPWVKHHVISLLIGPFLLRRQVRGRLRRQNLQGPQHTSDRWEVGKEVGGWDWKLRVHWNPRLNSNIDSIQRPNTKIDTMPLKYAHIMRSCQNTQNPRLDAAKEQCCQIRHEIMSKHAQTCQIPVQTHQNEQCSKYEECSIRRNVGSYGFSQPHRPTVSANDLEYSVSDLVHQAQAVSSERGSPRFGCSGICREDD
mgnify:CR=1 FL=1